MQMIAADGIGVFSVNRLAEAVDLTPGALYRYFPSREMILASVELEVLEEFDAYFERIDTVLGEETSLTRVIGLAEGYVALEQLRRERFRLISHFVSGSDPILSDGVAGELLAPTLRILNRMADALGSALPKQPTMPAEAPLQRVALLWSSLHGILERRKLARFAPDALEPSLLARQLLRTLLIGWGAESEDVDTALARFADPTFFADVLKELA